MHWQERCERCQNKSVEWTRFAKFPRISTLFFFLIYTQQLDIPRARVEFSTDGNVHTREDSFSFSLASLSVPSLGYDRSTLRYIDSSIFFPTQFGVERTLRIQPRRWTGFPSSSITPQFTMCFSPVSPPPPSPLPLFSGHAFYPAAIIRRPRSTSFFRLFADFTGGQQFWFEETRTRIVLLFSFVRNV